MIVELSDDRPRLTIGRSPRNDVALRWDAEVSRLHAELERVGGDWLVIDDQLSHNGTYVNGERLRSRRVLRAGDVIRTGDTQLAFVAPAGGSISATMTAARAAAAPSSPGRNGGCSSHCVAHCRTAASWRRTGRSPTSSSSRSTRSRARCRGCSSCSASAPTCRRIRSVPCSPAARCRTASWARTSWSVVDPSQRVRAEPDTQTCPSPTATANGLDGTRSGSPTGRPVFASRTTRVWLVWLATKTRPPATARPAGRGRRVVLTGAGARVEGRHRGVRRARWPRAPVP